MILKVLGLTWFRLTPRVSVEKLLDNWEVILVDVVAFFVPKSILPPLVGVELGDERENTLLKKHLHCLKHSRYDVTYFFKKLD